MVTRMLPLATGWSMAKTKQACGPVSIELLCWLKKQVSEIQQEKFPVATSLAGTGAMLPWDMTASLQALGFSARERHVSAEEGVAYLKERIDRGECSIIFTGRMIGHWLVVWGYDDDSFYCYDTSALSKPDSTGLSRYSYAGLLDEWGRLPRFIGSVLRLFGTCRPRFSVTPFTTIEW